MLLDPTAQEGGRPSSPKNSPAGKLPRRRVIGSSPEQRCGAPKRHGSSAKERGGDGESHRSTCGRRDGAETVVDEGPKRRRWLVAEGGDARSGRLGDASNGFVAVRRSSGWRLLAPAGLQRAARRRTEGATVVRRKGALGVVWRESERGAGWLYGVRRVRERDSESSWRRDGRGLAVRRNRSRAARPSEITGGG